MMQIVYVIGGISPEYEGWLQIGSFNSNKIRDLKPNSDDIRKLTRKYVNDYMLPAGQQYDLYWAEPNDAPLSKINLKLKGLKIPRYGKSEWFNTDVWTLRQVLKNGIDPRCVIDGRPVYNYRRLSLLKLAKYVMSKTQKELTLILKAPHNSKEQRFKRDFYNTWHLSSIDVEGINKTVELFSMYILLRLFINSVPRGCKKMFRKLIPLNVDDLNYDQKLLNYKSGLDHVLKIKRQINSLRGKPFGTLEFTNSYLIKNVKVLQIFDPKLLKREFRL